METSPTRSDGRHAVALAAVAAAVACVYANALDGGFVLDNRVLVVENPVVQQATLANVGFALTHDYWQPMATDGLYRPVAILSFMLNYAVLGNGPRPLGYHVLNVLLHVGCASAVYALVWLLVRRRWPAVVAALLFAVHPVATEAVTNIVGRADLLATLGVLVGLLCHARGQRLAGLGIAAAVAAFSKETGVVLIAVMVAWDLVVGGPRRRADYVVVGGVLAAYAVARWYVAVTGLPPSETAAVDNPLVEAGFWTGRLAALGVLGRELALVVWPRVLSADYSYRQIPVVAWDWRPFVVLAGLALVCVRVRRADPALRFLVVFAAIALLPTSNLLTLTGSIMAERFLYLPMAAFAGIAALLAERARREAGTAVVAVVLLACAWRGHVRNADWHDELSLWASALPAAPASAKVHKGYAGALLAANGDLDRVTAEAERAVEIRPDYLAALVDLGSYYLHQGDRGGDAGWYERAAGVLERARVLQADVDRRYAARIRARGGSVAAMANEVLLNDLALTYVRQRRFDDALAVFEEWRRFAPGTAKHYVAISAVLCNLGRWEDAAVTLFEATIIEPGNADAVDRLAQVYRTFDPQGHAVVADPSGQTRLDVDDPVVHRHRCRAYTELAGVYTAAGMPDAAARVRTLVPPACT